MSACTATLLANLGAPADKINRLLFNTQLKTFAFAFQQRGGPSQICMTALPMLTVRLGGSFSIVVRASALSGTALESRIAQNEGKAEVQLTDDDCGSIDELRDFLALCEHRWGVSRAPLASADFLRKAQRTMGMLRRQEANAVLDAVRETVAKDPVDSIAALGLASTVRIAPPIAETRGSDGTTTGRWFTDATAVRSGANRKAPQTVRRVLHLRQPTSREAQMAGALALLRAWASEDEATIGSHGPTSGLVAPSTVELDEYERLLAHLSRAQPHAGCPLRGARGARGGRLPDGQVDRVAAQV